MRCYLVRILAFFRGFPPNSCLKNRVRKSCPRYNVNIRRSGRILVKVRAKCRSLIMADQTVKLNGEVNCAVFSGFAEKVQRKWVKSKSPDQVVTCKLDGVKISTDANLFCRSNNVNFSWNVQVSVRGKILERIALTMGEQYRKNFILKGVFEENTEIGIVNGQEWCNEATDTTDIDPNKEARYLVKIHFVANDYGTYRENIMFYFGEYPVVLQRITMNCLPSEDFTRIHNATDYQLSQSPVRWVKDSAKIREFQSENVPPKDPKEAMLSKIYPYPDQSNFALTQESLTDRSLTPRNYRGRFHELIALEELARQEQIARYDQISHMRFLSCYTISSCSDAYNTSKYAASGELFAQLPLSRSISEDTKSGRLFLRGCYRILFKCLSDKSESAIFEGHIEDKCAQTVYIRLSKHCVDTLKLVANTDREVQVQFVLNRLPFCEWHRAVDTLPDVGLVFLNKSQMNQNNIVDLIGMDTLSSRETCDWLILSSLLNTEQKEAMTLMTAPITIPLPPILLLGPFGTGKTFTIAQALHILLTKNPDHKILLCTHSNSAADLYIKDFFGTWYRNECCPRLKPVRIFYKGRSISSVHPTVLSYSLTTHEGTFRDPTEEDVRDCGLIVTTLSTSSSLTSLNVTFTHIVIDEAAQALECELLIPLALANKQTRLILAGDQMQLAPEIYSDLAHECGMGVSLLERFSEMYPQTHPCRIHLCQNYRAQEDIIKFTSEVFYDGIVKPASNLLVRHPVLQPLTFYAVQGEEMQDTYTTGYTHAAEVYEIVNRVYDLKANWPVECWGPYGEGSIGVLAYYAEQVQRIRLELRQHKLSEVSVERVLNVQGKQFTAVFISTVRSRNCCRYAAEGNVKDYGFLTNPRLLNTAITRARCLVAVVGDPVALLTIGSCRKLWRRYLEIAHLHGIDRQTLNHYLSQVPQFPKVIPLNPLAEEFVPKKQQQSCCLIEYVRVPMTYPVIHCANHWDSQHR